MRALPDGFPDGSIPAAEGLGRRPWDAGRRSLAAWDAWGAARLGVTSVVRPAPKDVRAGKSADRELGDQELDVWAALLAVGPPVWAALYKPDAGRSAAQSCAEPVAAVVRKQRVVLGV